MDILKVKTLSKKFGGLQALSLVSFSIEKNEILGMIGPNGAGKTTMFNAICGVDLPDNGEIYFENKSIVALKPHEICKKGIARTFQLTQPFNQLTVLQNVMTGAYNRIESTRDAKSRSMEVLTFLSLWAKAYNKARELTIPERKRLEFARALASGPKLLLLDEIIAGLNPAEVDEMVKLIQQIRDMGITILMIEHVMKAIMKLSDRIVVLHHGEKIAEGKPYEISNNPNVITAYLGKKNEYT